MNEPPKLGAERLPTFNLAIQIIPARFCSEAHSKAMAYISHAKMHTCCVGHVLVNIWEGSQLLVRKVVDHYETRTTIVTCL